MRRCIVRGAASGSGAGFITGIAARNAASWGNDGVLQELRKQWTEASGAAVGMRRLRRLGEQAAGEVGEEQGFLGKGDGTTGDPGKRQRKGEKLNGKGEGGRQAV